MHTFELIKIEASTIQITEKKMSFSYDGAIRLSKGLQRLLGLDSNVPQNLYLHFLKDPKAGKMYFYFDHSAESGVLIRVLQAGTPNHKCIGQSRNLVRTFTELLDWPLTAGKLKTIKMDVREKPVEFPDFNPLIWELY